MMCSSMYVAIRFKKNLVFNKRIALKLLHKSGEVSPKVVGSTGRAFSYET